MDLLPSASYFTSPPLLNRVSNSIIGNAIREECAPVVYTVCSPAVNAIFQKNFLNFSDVLQAHASLKDVNVPVRTAGDQPYRLKDFQLRVFDVQNLCQPAAEEAEDFLTRLVTESSDVARSELKGDPCSIDALRKSAAAESSSSWFQIYSKEFSRALWFSDHEALDHPVACILAATLGDGDLVNTFRELTNSKYLPPLLKDGVADPEMHKHFVLVHDLHSGPSFVTDSTLVELKNAFGSPNVHVLAVNSLKEPNLNRPDIWSEHQWQQFSSTRSTPRTNQPPAECVGQFLSDSDIALIAEFVKEVAVQRIIPHMEHKVRDYNHQVVANRRGLRNQIKNLWFRKGKEDENPQGGYTFKSMESQIRVLADFCFMLRDYELALSNYRLLASDYRSDKAWKHYAGAQEMISMCLFFLDQSRRETEQCLESAYNFFQKGGQANGRYATRTALRLVGIYKAREQFREAAMTLTRASLEESNLRAGLLLEQAAFCFLRADPAMVRKYGFHMVLAGNRYNLSAQRKHAIRAYSYVSAVYEGHGWNYISDHCNFTLGRLSAFLGSFQEAVGFFMKLLNSSHQSANMQRTFLREFLYVLQSVESSDGKGPLDLGLPLVNVDKRHVAFEDQRTWASPDARMLPEALWTSLEEGMLPPAAAIVLPTWLDAPRVKGKGSETVATNACFAGEPIIVDVEFENPLAIAIEITNVKLVCELSPLEENAGSLHKALSSPIFPQLEEGNVLKTMGMEHSQSLAVGLSSMDSERGSSEGDGSPELQLPELRHVVEPERAEKEEEEEEGEKKEEEELCLAEEQSCNLLPNERVVMKLRVTPMHEGRLRLVGVEWTLHGEGRVAKGRKEFTLQGHGGGGKRKKRGSHVPPPHTRLNFLVHQAMPRLELLLHGLPQKCLEGEILRLTMELSNPSSMAIKNLKLRSSHPDLLLPGLPDELDAEIAQCLENPKHPWPKTGAIPHSAAAAGHVFGFPEGTLLPPGGTLLWPLWLHTASSMPSKSTNGSALSSIEFNVVLAYEPELQSGSSSHCSSVGGGAHHSPSLKFRTLRSTFTTKMEPSLKVSVHIAPSANSLSNQILRLDVANQHRADSIWLRQVSCAGSTWRMSPFATSAAMSASGDPALMSVSLAPTQLLPAGQTTSLFFQLQKGKGSREDVAEEEGGEGEAWASDIRLGAPESPSEPVIAVGAGPLDQFVARGRQLAIQRSESQKAEHPPQVDLGSDADPVDIVLIWECQPGIGTADERSGAQSPGATRIGSHHVCENRIDGWEPIRWALDGPSCLLHDFEANPVCEVPLVLNLRNCSSMYATVKVETATPVGWPSLDNSAEFGFAPNDQSGWHPIQVPSRLEGAEMSEANREHGVEQYGVKSAAPFMWIGATHSVLSDVAPGERKQVQLRVAIMAPGVVDLSSFKVSWELSEPKVENATENKGGAETREVVDFRFLQGKGKGHCFLTVVLPFPQ